MSGLDLWLYGTPVASVTVERRSRARMTFGSEAIERWGLGSRILTVAEPLTTDVLPPGRTAVILEGLLPEGDALATLENLFGAAPTDLLASIGRETLGAVTVLSTGEDLPGHGSVPLGPELSGEDIADRIRGLTARPLGVSPGTPVRLSLPGAQPKLPLHRIDGFYFDPTTDHPSTVIVKPEPGEWPRLVELEAWGLEVLAAAGVPTPNWEIASFEGIPALVVQRFDRVFEDGGFRRIHQEDLCMAVGARPGEKYATSSRSATSLARMATAVYQNVDDPDQDLDRFVRVVVANVAIGNCDGHARNLGLLHPDDGTTQLAPAYDVIPTYHYRGHDKILAQTVDGQQMRPETVNWEHLHAEVGTWRIRGAEEHLRDAVVAVREAVHTVGPPPDSPSVSELMADVQRLLP